MEPDAARLANRLLSLLSVKHEPLSSRADHPALAWRRAGLMAITGEASGPGLVCPVPLTTAADAALMALRALAPAEAPLPENGALLLGERARLLRLGRQGRVSANGSCRLIDTIDGRIALNLARDDDWDLVPILLGVDRADGWADVELGAAGLTSEAILTSGVELGLPIARDAFPGSCASPFVIQERSPPPSRGERPLVLDFSALWAGPLAASLLGMLGADVIKVESVHRLDGARRGHSGFYDLLNAGKRSVTVDFTDPDQMAKLQSLIARADIIFEASRPRALQRLGIDREAVVARGGIWTAITAHDDPDRVGFGDDAAVAGGLSTQMDKVWGKPLFAGDAIADPLTGIHAALAAWALWRQGRAGLVRLSLARTIAFACSQRAADASEVRQWQALAEADSADFYPLRVSPCKARTAGADNHLLR
jgi:crotonobetainyl-CoA:carnitine CoA-transferase CaiB-like acyl-CoA transferase